MPSRVFNRFRPNSKEFNDSGFSNQVGSQGKRLLNPDGTFNVKRTGLHYFHQLSIAHELITMPWLKFIVIVNLFYIVVNILFASVYYMIGMDQFMGPIVVNKMDEFKEAFFFSAQTITTVGYGRLNPIGTLSNLISSFEALTGLMLFSIVTGLIYGRFSRPVARLMYSKNALIAPFKEGTAFMFRVANEKTNDMAEVVAQLLLGLVIYENGKFVRKYYGLDLERKSVNALALTWTVVHPIDENSPLYNLTPQMMEEHEAEFLISVKGVDTTFSQTVYSRSSYHYSDLVWNAKFRPSFKRSEDGVETIIELDHLNDYDFVPAGQGTEEKKTT
jgi:inward rectifier potassium channel